MLVGKENVYLFDVNLKEVTVSFKIRRGVNVILIDFEEVSVILSLKYH